MNSRTTKRQQEIGGMHTKSWDGYGKLYMPIKFWKNYIRMRK
jgi:hypothetical protein